MTLINPQRLGACFDRGRNLPLRVLALIGLIAATGLPAVGAETPAPANMTGEIHPQAAMASIRIGISPGTWGGLNRNDVTAAIKAWAKTIMQQRGISLEVETRLFESTEEMANVLRSGHVDAVSVLADQFLSLDLELQPEAVFLALDNNSFTERYVLLVHQSSGISDVAGLQGRALLLQSSAQTSLAPTWLEAILAREALGSAKEVLKTITRTSSTTKAVLPVFFRQADACLVTAKSFEVASELNPQLRRDLRVLATSPEVVPSLFYFRPGYTSRVRDQLEPAILTLHETTAGLQVLTVFQTGKMIKCPVSCLDSARELLADLKRLRQAHAQKGEP